MGDSRRGGRRASARRGRGLYQRLHTARGGAAAAAGRRADAGRSPARGSAAAMSVFKRKVRACAHSRVSAERGQFPTAHALPPLKTIRDGCLASPLACALAHAQAQAGAPERSLDHRVVHVSARGVWLCHTKAWLLTRACLPWCARTARPPWLAIPPRSHLRTPGAPWGDRGGPARRGGARALHRGEA